MSNEKEQQEMFEKISTLIEQKVKIKIDVGLVEELLSDIQREQLKGLVYNAYLELSEKRTVSDEDGSR